jgi:hypothetical protein
MSLRAARLQNLSPSAHVHQEHHNMMRCAQQRKVCLHYCTRNCFRSFDFKLSVGSGRGGDRHLPHPRTFKKVKIEKTKQERNAANGRLKLFPECVLSYVQVVIRPTLSLLTLR